MAGAIQVRLARESDYDDVVEMSEGIYDGQDYLPLEFHEWLKIPKRHMFVAVINGKVVGLSSTWIIDDGKTRFAEAGRVHPQFQGKGVIQAIIREVNEFVTRTYPAITLKRSITIEENVKSMALSTTSEIVLLLYQLQGHAKDHVTLRKRLHVTYPQEETLPVYSFTKPEVLEVVISNRKAADQIFYLKRLAWIDLWVLNPHARSNIDYLFQQGDRMFADRRPIECNADCFPTSFSHGRRIDRVKFVLWACTIYTEDPAHFFAHMVQQLKAGMEVIKDPFLFSAFHSRNLIKECHKFIDDLEMEREREYHYVAFEIPVSMPTAKL